MVTGSHNPGEYNGLKMVVAGDTLSGEEIQDLRRRVEAGRFAVRRRQADARRRARRLRRAHRRRREARAAVQGRDRLRQRRRRRDRAAPVPAPGLRGDGTVLGGGRKFSESPSRSFQAGESFVSDSRTENRTGGTRPRLRRRRRPARRGHQGRQDHLSRPPADALREGRAVAQSGRRDHLRREMHAPARALDRAPRRARR